jgi:hypothetical protein
LTQGLHVNIRDDPTKGGWTNTVQGVKYFENIFAGGVTEKWSDEVVEGMAAKTRKKHKKRLPHHCSRAR